MAFLLFCRVLFLWFILYFCIPLLNVSISNAMKIIKRLQFVDRQQMGELSFRNRLPFAIYCCFAPLQTFFITFWLLNRIAQSQNALDESHWIVHIIFLCSCHIRRYFYAFFFFRLTRFLYPFSFRLTENVTFFFFERKTYDA